MDDLDPNERGRILSLIDDALALPEIGRVTQVYEHTDPSDQSNHEVDVAIPPGETPTTTHRRVPIVQPTSGAALVPQVGDMVRVSFIGGEGERPVVDGIVYGDADQDRAPIATEGDVRLRRGDLEVELAGDGSNARLALRPDATTAPELVVEIDASGTIQLGKPDGTLKPIARKGDAVSGSTSDGATFSGTIDEGSSDVEST